MLLDAALDPVSDRLRGGAKELKRLKRRLGVVVSPESAFTLIDFDGLSGDEAVDEIVEVARQITSLALA